MCVLIFVTFVNQFSVKCKVWIWILVICICFRVIYDWLRWSCRFSYRSCWSALLIVFFNIHDSFFTSIRVIAESLGGHLLWRSPWLLRMFGNVWMSWTVLHCFQLCSNLVFNDLDLGFWVKPQSITWFLTFMLQEYDDERWTSLFWMTKVSVFLTSLTTYVRTFTNKTHIIPVIVKVVCTLFKPTQGSSMILYSELFAIGK